MIFQGCYTVNVDLTKNSRIHAFFMTLNFILKFLFSW